MNPWVIFIAVASWLGVMLALFLIVFIVWLFADSMWDTIVKRMQKKRDNIDQYLNESRTVANDFHNDGQTNLDFRAGFLAGARWGWGYFHRLKK